MAEQPQPTRRKQRQAPESAAPTPKGRKIGKTMGETTATLEMLRTEADRVRGPLRLLGFGRRILVPADEIHVVVGDGRHSLFPSKKSRVYGQTAERSSIYWLNRLTQVIKLKTISFTVPIRGVNDGGVPALDSSKVSFILSAHAVAKLNPAKAEVAAQRVGLDATSLINTITEVGTAELVAAAAAMTLEEIIAKRQKLAEIAFPQVNQILSELGYDLALLTITNLGGVAYEKLINQAEARISKETSVSTNREQVAEMQDDQARQRQEAEIQAQTEKKLAAERLDAEREVQTATLDQQETIAIRRHEVQLRQVDRDKDAAQTSHETNMAKVQLARQLSEAEVDKDAQLARLQAEREAELRAMQQERNATIHLAETEAEAQRMAVDQARQIERDAERTEAEAKRLEQEELAAAERAKEIALVEASQLAEAMKVEAEAGAKSELIRADAETQAELVRADAETKAELIRAEAQATATEKRAQAAKIRAEATRAETAAPGLAEVEVDSARVEIAEKQVAVTRADGLAKAEVAQAQAVAEAERVQRLKDVEIKAQRELVKLYDQAPVLVELEKLRLQLAHEERITTLQMESYLKGFEALAPSMQVRVYGGGGQTTQIITELMSLAQGVQYLGEEVPAVGRILDGVGTEKGSTFLPRLAEFTPYIRQALANVNPRMFSSLKIVDLIDRLNPVLAGQEDLVTALANLRENANFRVVGDIPVAPLLGLLGINLPQPGVGNVEDAIPLDETPPAEPQALVPAEAEEPTEIIVDKEENPDIAIV
ncbi:MAG: hypothetical protein GY832_32380 [Chloroflexi bacterium]|nr:hypothetical protein [Chloroflexota bacterium]